MAKYERNAGKPWNPAEFKKLRELAGKNTPTRVIGLIMGRPVGSIYSQASENGISLKPHNKSSRGYQK